jgi:hypothetical protein
LKLDGVAGLAPGGSLFEGLNKPVFPYCLISRDDVVSGGCGKDF